MLLERPKPLSKRLNYRQLSSPAECREGAARFEAEARRTGRLNLMREAKRCRREADVREAWIKAGNKL